MSVNHSEDARAFRNVSAFLDSYFDTEGRSRQSLTEHQRRQVELLARCELAEGEMEVVIQLLRHNADALDYLVEQIKAQRGIEPQERV